MNKTLYIALLALCAGCSLETVSNAQKCPPSSDASAKAYDYEKGKAIQLEDTICPEERPICTAYTIHGPNVGYFCSRSCDGESIPCDGNCVKPGEAGYAACRALSDEKQNCKKHPDLCSANQTCGEDGVCVNNEKPCTGDDCEKPCTGDNCETPCTGDDCEKPCTGDDCEKPCTGDDCEKPCTGDDCEKPCTGDNCEKPCTGDECGSNPQPPKSCEGMCGSDARCGNEIECINRKDEYPQFCRDSKVIEFFKQNYSVLYDIASIADHSEACLKRKELDALFTSQGPAVCDQIEMCITGSQDSFYKCVSYLIDEIEKGERTDLSIFQKEAFEHIRYLRNNCDKCTDSLYCHSYQQCQNGQCIHLQCENSPSLCDGSITCISGVCESGECQNNECVDKSNVPLFCKDPSIESYLASYYSALDVMINEKNQNALCNEIEDLRKVYQSGSAPLCTSIATCSEGSDLSFFKCTSDYLKRINSGKAEIPEGYTKPSSSLTIMSLVTRLNSVSSGKSGCIACGDNYCDEKYFKCKNNQCVKQNCNDRTTMCATVSKCIGAECMNNSDTKLPQFCLDSKWTAFAASHFNTMYSMEQAAAHAGCSALQSAAASFETYYTKEFVELCNSMTYCSTGSKKSYYTCLADYVGKILNGSLQPPDAYKGQNLSISVKTAFETLAAGKSVCGN